MIDNNNDPIKGYSESKHSYSGKYDLNGNNENYMVSDDVYDDAIKSTKGASIIIFILLIVGGILAIMMTMLFAELSSIPDEKVATTTKKEVVQDTRTADEIISDHLKTEEKYKDYPFERIDYIAVDNNMKLYTIYGAIEYTAEANSIYDLDSTKYNPLTNIVEVTYNQEIPLQKRYDYVDWLLENGYVYAGVYNSETIYTKDLEDSYMFVSITPKVLTYGVSDGNSSELFQ